MKNKDENKRVQLLRRLQKQDLVTTEYGIGLRSMACHSNGKDVYSEAIVCHRRNFERDRLDSFDKADPMDIIYVYPREHDEAVSDILGMQTKIMHGALSAKAMLAPAQLQLAQLCRKRPKHTAMYFARQMAESVLPQEAPEELIQSVARQFYVSATK